MQHGDKASKVMESGKVVATMATGDNTGITGKLYCNIESHGYHTDFTYKKFFYLITYRNLVPIHCEGVTRDCRRHNFTERCQKEGLGLDIVDHDLFQEWVGGKLTLDKRLRV